MLATVWIFFGGLAFVLTLAILADPMTTYAGWQWTTTVSVGLVLGGIGILRRHRRGRWIAVAAVLGGLLEAAAWLLWMWTPILVATGAFHTYGLVALVLGDFSPASGDQAADIVGPSTDGGPN
ncbi:MAG: hypothetical protein KY456_01085 [Chloroflexi bacterium]|nr:hypothetical protein [Chloroflexota bacterium]